MKRINKIAYPLLLTLLLAACSREAGVTEQEETRPVNIQVNIDPTDADGVQTRAGGSGTCPEGNVLRCILAVYVNGQTSGGPLTKVVTTSESLIFNIDNVRLPAGNTYQVVCWADYVPENTTADVYYDTTDLMKITQKPGAAAGSAGSAGLPGSTGKEAEDAYTCHQELVVEPGGTVTGDLPLKLTLKRPLTRVQLSNITLNETPSVTSYALRCKWGDSADETALQYNALTGTVAGSVATFYPATQLFTIGGVNNCLYGYFFKAPTPEQMTLTLVTKEGSEYGMKDGSSNNSVSPSGKPIVVTGITQNRKIEIKGENNGSLTLYKINPPSD